MDDDGLGAADWCRGRDDIMPEIGQVPAHRITIAPFNLHLSGIGKAAGCVDGLLWFHAKIGKVGHEAGMAIGLIGPAHDSEGHERIAVMQDGGDDGGIGRFPPFSSFG